MTWQPIATVPPFVVVMLYRAGDLYPTIGWKADDGEIDFVLEEGGPEDGTHRRCPTVVYPPTHWAPLPETPEGDA